MTVVELTGPLSRELDPVGRPELRLVEGGAAARPAAARGTRRVPAAVRRRRSLLVAMSLLLGILALPLGGAGGHSHAPGSALAGVGRSGLYVVRPGDTLWSIAERVDPSGDPRPIVARLAAQLGTDTVVPGEQLTLS